MALMLALSAFGCLIDGFRSRELRQRVAALMGVGLEQYSASQMSYDLRRLRRKGAHLSGQGEPTLLSDSLRLEAGKTLRTLGGQGLSPGPDRYERTANRTVRPTERRTAHHRYRTKPIVNSGLPHPQSCLKKLGSFVQLFDTMNG
jgi:hypothetical protein